MAGRAGAILPIALGVVLARWGGAVGAPRPSQRLRAAAIRIPVCPGPRSPRGGGVGETFLATDSFHHADVTHSFAPSQFLSETKHSTTTTRGLYL